MGVLKLLTKELEKRFTELKVGNQDVICKFFTPWTGWTWYATEYSNGVFFGLVNGLEKEYGYFSLAELEKVTGPGGLKIERDLYWTERDVKEVEDD